MSATLPSENVYMTNVSQMPIDVRLMLASLPPPFSQVAYWPWAPSRATARALTIFADESVSTDLLVMVRSAPRWVAVGRVMVRVDASAGAAASVETTRTELRRA